MLVVADSSPLNFIIRLGHTEVLPALFERVSIPPAVATELTRPMMPKAVRDLIAQPPTWLDVIAPITIERIPGIDPGEEAAISLARQLRADALLIDEKDGRRAAAARGVQIVGTVGILESAAERRLLNLATAFEQLKATEFRIRPEYLDDRLRRHQSRS